MNACQRLDEIWDADPDGVLVRALWSSALVAYARCFESGRRLRLPADALEVLEMAERQLHGTLLVERDKHIAHQADDLERVLLSVVGRTDGNSQTVEGVAVLMAKQIGPPREKVAQVRELAAKLKSEATRRRESATASLLAEAQNRLTRSG